jgi:hypothetical protein
MLRDPATDREMHGEVDVVERHEGGEQEHGHHIEREDRAPVRSQRTEPLRTPER